MKYFIIIKEKKISENVENKEQLKVPFSLSRFFQEIFKIKF